MNPLPAPISEIGIRYPNLTRACQWVGNLTATEACLVLWAVKNHIPGPVGSKRVKLFGDPEHLTSQAVRARNQ